jgi:hypothetical protein
VESATGPMEKIPYRGDNNQVQPHTVEHWAGSCFTGIRRAISSSRSRRSRPVELRLVENASSGGHIYATPAGHDLIVTLLRPAATYD